MVDRPRPSNEKPCLARKCKLPPKDVQERPSGEIVAVTPEKKRRLSSCCDESMTEKTTHTHPQPQSGREANATGEKSPSLTASPAISANMFYSKKRRLIPQASPEYNPPVKESDASQPKIVKKDETNCTDSGKSLSSPTWISRKERLLQQVTRSTRQQTGNVPKEQEKEQGDKNQVCSKDKSPIISPKPKEINSSGSGDVILTRKARLLAQEGQHNREKSDKTEEKENARDRNSQKSDKKATTCGVPVKPQIVTCDYPEEEGGLIMEAYEEDEVVEPPRTRSRSGLSSNTRRKGASSLAKRRSPKVTANASGKAAIKEALISKARKINLRKKKSPLLNADGQTSGDDSIGSPIESGRLRRSRSSVNSSNSSSKKTKSEMSVNKNAMKSQASVRDSASPSVLANFTGHLRTIRPKSDKPESSATANEQPTIVIHIDKNGNITPGSYERIMQSISKSIHADEAKKKFQNTKANDTSSKQKTITKAAKEPKKSTIPKSVTSLQNKRVGRPVKGPVAKVAKKSPSAQSQEGDASHPITIEEDSQYSPKSQSHSNRSNNNANDKPTQKKQGKSLDNNPSSAPKKVIPHLIQIPLPGANKPVVAQYPVIMINPSAAKGNQAPLNRSANNNHEDAEVFQVQEMLMPRGPGGRQVVQQVLVPISKTKVLKATGPSKPPIEIAMPVSAAVPSGSRTIVPITAFPTRPPIQFALPPKEVNLKEPKSNVNPAEPMSNVNSKKSMTSVNLNELMLNVNPDKAMLNVNSPMLNVDPDEPKAKLPKVSDPNKPPSEVVMPPSEVVRPPIEVVRPPSEVVMPPSEVVMPPSEVVRPPSEVVMPPQMVVPDPKTSMSKPASEVSVSVDEGSNDDVVGPPIPEVSAAAGRTSEEKEPDRPDPAPCVKKNVRKTIRHDGRRPGLGVGNLFDIPLIFNNESDKGVYDPRATATIPSGVVPSGPISSGAIPSGDDLIPHVDAFISPSALIREIADIKPQEAEDYHGGIFLFGAQPRRSQKKISFTDKEKPKNLQEVICMYIDSLIEENYELLQISHSDLPIIPINWDREIYAQVALQKPTEFPSKKLQTFLEQFNIELQVFPNADQQSNINNNACSTILHDVRPWMSDDILSLTAGSISTKYEAKLDELGGRSKKDLSAAVREGKIDSLYKELVLGNLRASKETHSNVLVTQHITQLLHPPQLDLQNFTNMPNLPQMPNLPNILNLPNMPNLPEGERVPSEVNSAVQALLTEEYPSNNFRPFLEDLASPSVPILQQLQAMNSHVEKQLHPDSKKPKPPKPKKVRNMNAFPPYFHDIEAHLKEAVSAGFLPSVPNEPQKAPDKQQHQEMLEANAPGDESDSADEEMKSMSAAITLTNFGMDSRRFNADNPSLENGGDCDSSDVSTDTNSQTDAVDPEHDSQSMELPEEPVPSHLQRNHGMGSLFDLSDDSVDREMLKNFANGNQISFLQTTGNANNQPPQAFPATSAPQLHVSHKSTSFCDLLRQDNFEDHVDPRLSHLSFSSSVDFGNQRSYCPGIGGHPQQAPVVQQQSYYNTQQYNTSVSQYLNPVNHCPNEATSDGQLGMTSGMTSEMTSASDHLSQAQDLANFPPDSQNTASILRQACESLNLDPTFEPDAQTRIAQGSISDNTQSTSNVENHNSILQLEALGLQPVQSESSHASMQYSSFVNPAPSSTPCNNLSSMSEQRGAFKRLDDQGGQEYAGDADTEDSNQDPRTIVQAAYNPSHELLRQITETLLRESLGESATGTNVAPDTNNPVNDHVGAAKQGEVQRSKKEEANEVINEIATGETTARQELPDDTTVHEGLTSSLQEANVQERIEKVPGDVNLVVQKPGNVNLVEKVSGDENLVGQMPGNVNLDGKVPQYQNLVEQVPGDVVGKVLGDVSLVEEMPEDLNLARKLPGDGSLQETTEESTTEESDPIEKTFANMNMLGKVPRDVNLVEKVPGDLNLVGAVPGDVNLVGAVSGDVNLVGKFPGDGSSQETNIQKTAEESNPIDKVFGDMTLVGKVPGDVNLVEKVPGDFNLVGEVPGDVDLVGKVPGDEDMVGKVPGDVNMVEKVPGDMTMVRKVPRDVNLVEKVPGEEDWFGKKPGDTSLVGTVCEPTLEEDKADEWPGCSQYDASVSQFHGHLNTSVPENIFDNPASDTN